MLHSGVAGNTVPDIELRNKLCYCIFSVCGVFVQSSSAEESLVCVTGMV